jgi:Uma2 family endonuclease
MNVLLERTYTADDLLTLPDGDHYELVDGKLVEKDVGTKADYIATKLARLLGNHCENPWIAWVLSEASYQFLPGRPNVVRKPDVSVIRLGRFPDEKLPDGHTRFAPDLAVEVVSPKDLYYEVDQKVSEYRAGGVPLIWIISPPSQTVLIRRLNGSVSEVGVAGELSGEDVVPGFRCRVADIFPPTPPPTPPAPLAPPNGTK